MAFIGVIVMVLGFVVALMSLGMVASTSGRMIAVVAGLAITLFGLIGLLNPAYIKTALWKK
ncbi:MAG: hypothetical protein ABI693_04450 [Bryobacteraceae bacterium]|jgi:hypothetical protein